MGVHGRGLQSTGEGNREKQNEDVFSCCSWVRNSNPSGSSEGFMKYISEPSSSGIKRGYIHWLLAVIGQAWLMGTPPGYAQGSHESPCLGNEGCLQAGSKSLWEAFSSCTRACRDLPLLQYLDKWRDWRDCVVLYKMCLLYCCSVGREI